MKHLFKNSLIISFSIHFISESRRSSNIYSLEIKRSKKKYRKLFSTAIIIIKMNEIRQESCWWQWQELTRILQRWYIIINKTQTTFPLLDENKYDQKYRTVGNIFAIAIFVPTKFLGNAQSFLFLVLLWNWSQFKTRRLIRVEYFTKADTKYTHNNGRVNCCQMISYENKVTKYNQCLLC